MSPYVHGLVNFDTRSFHKIVHEPSQVIIKSIDFSGKQIFTIYPKRSLPFSEFQQCASQSIVDPYGSCFIIFWMPPIMRLNCYDILIKINIRPSHVGYLIASASSVEKHPDQILAPVIFLVLVYELQYLLYLILCQNLW